MLYIRSHHQSYLIGKTVWYRLLGFLVLMGLIASTAGTSRRDSNGIVKPVLHIAYGYSSVKGGPAFAEPDVVLAIENPSSEPLLVEDLRFSEVFVSWLSRIGRGKSVMRIRVPTGKRGAGILIHPKGVWSRPFAAIAPSLRDYIPPRVGKSGTLSIKVFLQKPAEALPSLRQVSGELSFPVLEVKRSDFTNLSRLRVKEESSNSRKGADIRSGTAAGMATADWHAVYMNFVETLPFFAPLSDWNWSVWCEDDKRRGVMATRRRSDIDSPDIMLKLEMDESEGMPYLKRLEIERLVEGVAGGPEVLQRIPVTLDEMRTEIVDKFIRGRPLGWQYFLRRLSASTSALERQLVPN